MSASYLSIDVDYWTAQPWLWKHDGAVRSCHRFFQRVHDLGVPIRVVDSHEHLLPFVNRSKARKLVNVDYHSDVCEDTPKLELDCGTWVTHVQWRRDGTFDWIRPTLESEFDGRCDERWRWSGGEIPFYAIPSGWSYQHDLVGIAHVPWSEVIEIGVAISSEFWCHVSRGLTARFITILSNALGTRGIKPMHDVIEMCQQLHQRNMPNKNRRTPDRLNPTI